jgi:hypothetical protein
MKKILVLLVLMGLFLTACNAVKVVTPTPDIEATVQVAVEKALASQPTAIPQSTVIITVIETPVPTVSDPIAPKPEGQMSVQQISAEMPVAMSEAIQGKWEVSFYEGATDQMHGWFSNLKDPNPALWPDFPNVDNPTADFVAANGLEYGLDESVFMEQNEFGQFPVQARGYRLISGDYNIPGIDVCEAETEKAGCAIAIFNVGEVTADLKAWVRQGFTVPGRYWNGDTLEQAMWGLSSHVSANMLNMNTNGAGNDTLNNPNRTNAGANCSVVDGCDQVRFVIAITSGNQLLVKAITFVK